MKLKKIKEKILNTTQTKIRVTTTWLASIKNQTQNAIQNMQDLRKLNKFASKIGNNMCIAMDTGEMMQHLARTKLIISRAMDSETPLKEINRALEHLKGARKLAKGLV